MLAGCATGMIPGHATPPATTASVATKPAVPGKIEPQATHTLQAALAKPTTVETIRAEAVKKPVPEARGWSAATEGKPVRSSTGEPAASTEPQDQSPAGDQMASAGEVMWSTKPKPAPGGGGEVTPALYTPRINPTNRLVEIETPVREDKFILGNLVVRIAPMDVISIERKRLLGLLKPLLRPKVFAALEAIPAEDGFIRLTDLVAAGFAFRFDSGQVELQLALSVEQRGIGNLSAGRKRDKIVSENLSKPATVSGYVNIRTGIDFASRQFFEDGEVANPRVDLQGAARWLDVVLESQAAVDEMTGFARGGTRFVYDMPEKVVRLSAGDVNPLRTYFQGGSDLLGVTAEKSYQKLQPGYNIHPTGSSSFRLERQSTVEVMNNGVMVQRLSLRPGDYNLSDLPLTTGANEVSLVITDDVGTKRTLHFTVFSGQALLAPGVSEWAFSGGIVSRIGAQDPDIANFYSKLHYDFDQPAITGYYRRGLTADLTGEAHLQADSYTVMGGASAFFQTAFGYWAIGGATSNLVDYGLGFAATIAYDLANIRGGDGVRRGIRLGADFHSEDFATIGTLVPNNTTALRLAATYYQELPWSLSGSVSVNYGFGREDYGDQFGVDLNLARSFGPSLSAGLTVGYDQSATSSSITTRNDGLRAMVHLAYRRNEKSAIDTSYDTRDGRVQLGYRTQGENGAGSWSAQIDSNRREGTDDSDDSCGLNGSISYTGNRLEAGLSHYSTMVGIDGSAVDQRTTLTNGTAIAFADGRFAVGRPIGNGFAIVEPHTNLDGSTITIGAQGRSAASSDFLGPALVSDLSPYSAAHLPIEVTNLPVGYDLGAGAFDLFAHYRTGYRLTVGSDYTVSAIGTLVDGQGEPIALLTGDAYEEGQSQGRHVQIFTNRAGRFGAQGLRPGRWLVDMATDPKTRFVIEVPDGTNGMLRLGTLKPAMRE